MKLLAAVMLFTFSLMSDKEINILVITGGHDFEEEAFLGMFEQMPGIKYTHVSQPYANEMIADDKVKAFDVLLFYDMYDSITSRQKTAYTELLNSGKGMIFMHHSLVSYQNWSEFKSIIGGKYYENEGFSNGKKYKSTYRHDVDIPIEVVAAHPVVNGINDFVLFDEVYGNCEISEDITPLLSTTHPQSMEHVAWINEYGSSDVIYIQPGHGHTAFKNQTYQKLLLQAIRWSAERHGK